MVKKKRTHHSTITARPNMLKNKRKRRELARAKRDRGAILARIDRVNGSKLPV